MISEALNFAQQRPVTSGLIVIGAGALIYFVSQPQVGSSPVLSQNAADLYTRPSDAEIAAAAQIASDQMAFSRASEDAQITAVLADKSLDYEYDLERSRIGTALAQVQGANAVALKQQDVALSTAGYDYGLGLAAITSQYNIASETTQYQTALDALRSNNDLAKTRVTSENDYRGLVYTADNDYRTFTYGANTSQALARIDADRQVQQAQINYDSMAYAADAQVRAAKASKNKGFGFSLPGIGGFNISF
jgi:hypothetical protein